MRSLRLALAFAATMFAVAVSEAQPPFTPTPATPTPLAVALLPGIDDPVVVAELKLSDEQVKALVARRKELWDEAYTTAPNKLAEKAAERNDATDALLKKTLSAEQYNRATQLGAQSVLSRGFGNPDGPPVFNLTRVTSTTLTRYPELANAFKLTDEQKKQLAAPAPKGGGPGGFGGRSILMSKEQAENAEKFLGTVAKSWEGKFDPRNSTRPLAPAELTLLGAKDVRTELKLADAEGKALAELAEKWSKLTADRRTTLSPKEADEQAAALKTESEKALGALKPEQATRLKQVVFQTNLSRGGFGSITATDLSAEALHTNPTVAKELAITEKQIEEFAAVREAFEKEAAAVLAAASAAAPAEKKLNDLVAARRKKGEAVLTAEQTAKFKALVGEPFTGNTRDDRFFGGPRMSEAERAAWFGKYTFGEFSMLANNKAVQEELKLDEKQLKQIEEVRDTITTKFPPRGRADRDDEAEAKVIAARSAFVAEQLAKVLTEDQAKRFRQLRLQYWESNSRGFGTMVASAAAYPGVAEEIKLTDEQKKKLIAGTAPSDVLTVEQKSAIKKMLGDPFKGEFETRFGGSPFPQASATVRLLTGRANAKVAEEALKLTDEQSKKLAAVREAHQKAIADARPSGPGSGVNFNEYLEAMRKAYEAFDKVVTELLTDEQKRRLAQLVVQADAAQNLVTTLTAPEVAKKLELTKEQIEKLTALGSDATRLQDLRTTHLRFERDAKLGLQMRDAADDRTMALLTDAQKKKWKELTGDPLPGLVKTIPGRFGPGGFGGPGFGGPPGAPGGGFGVPPAP